MKKQIFSLLALAAITVSASAQSNTAMAVVNKNVINEVMKENAGISVSNEISKSFEKVYPLAQDAQWVKMEKNYRVAFVNANNNTIAVFHDNGKFQYSITDVTFEQLPVVLKQIIENDYKGSKIYKSVSINNQGNITHQVILEGNTHYTILKAVGEDVEVSSMQNASAIK
jgi:predicted nucleotide-binding protein (sugar kinase/HSP70/actin superfamily)